MRLQVNISPVMSLNSITLAVLSLAIKIEINIAVRNISIDEIFGPVIKSQINLYSAKMNISINTFVDSSYYY